MEEVTNKGGMSTGMVVGIAVIVVAVFGGGVYAYVNSKTEKEKKDLNAQITEFQNEVSSAKTATTTAPSPSISAIAPSVNTATDWKGYKNTKYGFSLTFNDLWKNYQIVEKKPDDKTALAYLYVCVPTTSSIWRDVQAGVFCPFSITVVNAGNYEEFKQANDPIIPTYINKNSSYVFSYSTAQDRPDDGVSVMNDLKNIVATFKLTQ